MPAQMYLLLLFLKDINCRKAPSLRNSGEKNILLILNFSFILFVKPIGTVDFITIVMYLFILIAFSIISSTVEVSKLFVSSL